MGQETNSNSKSIYYLTGEERKLLLQHKAKVRPKKDKITEGGAAEAGTMAEVINQYLLAHPELEQVSLAKWLRLTLEQLERLECCRRPGWNRDRNIEIETAFLCEVFGIEGNKLEVIIKAGKTNQ